LSFVVVVVDIVFFQFSCILRLLLSIMPSRQTARAPLYHLIRDSSGGSYTVLNDNGCLSPPSWSKQPQQQQVIKALGPRKTEVPYRGDLVPGASGKQFFYKNRKFKKIFPEHGFSFLFLDVGLA
jgi:hypothetical protein